MGGPPEAGERGSSPIDQWVHGLRDDIDEIAAEILQSDIEEARDQRKKTEAAKVEDWSVSKICEELKNGRFKNFVLLGPVFMTISKLIISMNLKISSLWISSRRIQNHFTHSQRKSCPETFLRQSVITSLLRLKKKAF